MAIVLPLLRPALDIVKGGFETPEPPWAYLSEPEHRGRLEAAISAVSRLEFVGNSTVEWGGTAFVVGSGLLVTNSSEPVLESGSPKPRFRPGQSAVVDFGRFTRTQRNSKAALRNLRGSSRATRTFGVTPSSSGRIPAHQNWKTYASAERSSLGPDAVSSEPRVEANPSDDGVPIDWTRGEPKALQELLGKTVPADMAVYMAESVGLQLGTVSHMMPELMWREIMKKASLALLLRPLLEAIAAAPQHLAIAPKIREYL